MLQVNELNLLFGKIIDRLNPNKNFEHYYPQLHNIIEKIVAHAQDFELLFAMVIYLLFTLTRLFKLVHIIFEEKFFRRISYL